MHECSENVKRWSLRASEVGEPECPAGGNLVAQHAGLDEERSRERWAIPLRWQMRCTRTTALLQRRDRTRGVLAELGMQDRDRVRGREMALRVGI